MISRKEYLQACDIVHQYKDEQERLKKYEPFAVCPFCSGSKITPYMGRSQKCNVCNENGSVSSKYLITVGLEDYLVKKEK